MKFVIFGLSITSSWGNGHATTYRALVKQLVEMGHDVLFLEHEKPWYAKNRDLLHPEICDFALYDGLEGVKTVFQDEVANADCVIVGSYVPEGLAIGDWVVESAEGVTAFYDLDTPITAESLAVGTCEYVSQQLVSRYDLYLSFSGGPLLEELAMQYGIRSIHPLYCAIDLDAYYPDHGEIRWDLGYLGTYAKNRQSQLQKYLISPARELVDQSFIVAGSGYPTTICWKPNINRFEHIKPYEHRSFYNAQRFTLNITRKQMLKSGYSPSVRLFEAGACGVPIISDRWEGIESFFVPGEEILLAEKSADVIEILQDLDENERNQIGRRARERILREHTPACRAEKLINLVLGAKD